MTLEGRTLLAVAAPLLAMATAAAVPTYAAANQPQVLVDLSGRWQLNPELSQRARRHRRKPRATPCVRPG